MCGKWALHLRFTGVWSSLLWPPCQSPFIVNHVIDLCTVCDGCIHETTLLILLRWCFCVFRCAAVLKHTELRSCVQIKSYYTCNLYYHCVFTETTKNVVTWYCHIECMKIWRLFLCKQSVCGIIWCRKSQEKNPNRVEKVGTWALVWVLVTTLLKAKLALWSLLEKTYEENM